MGEEQWFRFVVAGTGMGTLPHMAVNVGDCVLMNSPGWPEERLAALKRKGFVEPCEAPNSPEGDQSGKESADETSGENTAGSTETDGVSKSKPDPQNAVDDHKEPKHPQGRAKRTKGE